MNSEFTPSSEITIEFTEQQMELIRRVAEETGKSPSEVVTVALDQFIRGQGAQYMATW
jgi:hypothetical protein